MIHYIMKSFILMDVRKLVGVIDIGLLIIIINLVDYLESH